MLVLFFGPAGGSHSLVTFTGRTLARYVPPSRRIRRVMIALKLCDSAPAEPTSRRNFDDAQPAV
jgi:hypothetical protein